MLSVKIGISVTLNIKHGLQNIQAISVTLNGVNKFEACIKDVTSRIHRKPAYQYLVRQSLRFDLFEVKCAQGIESIVGEFNIYRFVVKYRNRKAVTE